MANPKRTTPTSIPPLDRGLYREVEPVTQLDFFVDRDGVAARGSINCARPIAWSRKRASNCDR
jgi:hypothetical protein